MTRIRILGGVSLFTIAAVFGCSSDDKAAVGNGPDASAGGGGSGGKAGSGGAAGTSGGAGSGGGGAAGTAGSGGSAPDGGGIFFTGTVVEATPGKLFMNEPFLAGVQVCVVKADGTKDTAYTCVTTTADGSFSLGPLKATTRIIAEFSKAGYLKQAKPLDVGTGSIALPTSVSFRMVALEGDGGTTKNFGWDPSVTPDLTKGSLNFFATKLHVGDGGPDIANGVDWADGTSVTITPASGDGPFYLDGSEQFRTGATTIGANGYGGWYLNLSAGEYVLTFSNAALNCGPLPGNAFGWPEGPHSIRVPVLVGKNTQAVGVFCTVPSPDAGAPKDAGPG